MPVKSTRLLPIAAGVFLLACAATTHAQTTINLNTANGNCVAVTDAAGLSTDSTPGSVSLRANGVTLTAGAPGACNPVGGSSSMFQANVQTSGSQTPGTPFTPAVGSPFYVIWSASADATACTYGGNFSSGITGWNLGSRACTDGASCSATHAVQVTPTAAGNYSFSVTCTNASGYAATSGVNVPQPATPAPTPNPIPLTAPAGASAGVAFAVTWPQMQNAARCVGTGTLGGSPTTSLGDWNTITTVSNTAANSRSVVVPSTATGTLKLTLTCWNADDSASATGTTGDITITPPAAGNCPATITAADGPRNLLTTSDVRYGTQSGTRMNVNLSEWDNVWGHGTGSPTEGITPWPGVSGSAPTILAFKRDSYVGIHFKTPVSPAPGTAGTWFNPTSNPGPNLTMAISTQCGDFTNHLPSPGCRVENVPTADAPMVYWWFGTTFPNTSCNLQPNTNYYVNIMQTDKASTLECSGNVCPAAAWRQ